LENAVNILHEKSEEIESLQNQLMEEHARYNGLQTDFERIQAELDALLAQKNVQRDALTEAKDHIKSLTALIDSLTLRHEAYEENKRQLIVDQDKARRKWNEERERIVRELEVLERQNKDLETSMVEHTQHQTNSDSDWFQKQTTWERMKESWSAEKDEWLKKENIWQSEKEGLQKAIQDRDKEIERLEAVSKSAQDDSELFRNQYGAASSFADSVRAENVELQKRNDELQKQAAVAHGQAQTGVQLVKEVYLLRVKRLEEELGKTRRLYECLKTRDERTNDEIRRLAASYPELVDENTKLQQELEKLRDIQGSIARIMDDSNENRSEDYVDKGMSAESSPESLEYEDDAHFQGSRFIPKEGDDGEVYCCLWEWCSAAFNELQVCLFHFNYVS
jgi:chromosome segregation ATPase